MFSATVERSPVEVLRAAKERISDPDRWARGEFAYHGNTEFDYTAPDSPEACRWCAAGSVLAEYGLEDLRWGLGLEHAPALAVLARALGVHTSYTPGRVIAHIAEFNDAAGRSHGEVLALFDRAIELAEAEQS